MIVVLLSLAAAILFSAVVVIVAADRELRRNKPLVAGVRLVACVVVQLIAVLVATQLVTEPNEVKGVYEAVESSASEILAIVGIIVVDVVAVTIIALYKSEWVEPPLR